MTAEGDCFTEGAGEHKGGVQFWMETEEEGVYEAGMPSFEQDLGMQGVTAFSPAEGLPDVELPHATKMDVDAEQSSLAPAA